jgi:response regulator RpfG family c-di-GMP phosphodiesterase
MAQVGRSSLLRDIAESGVADWGFRIDADNLAVRREQLHARLAMYPTMVLVQMVLEPLFVWMFWTHVPHMELLLWWALIYSLHMVELLRWARYRHAMDSLEECREWHLHFTAFAFAVGALWGVAGLAFYPVDLLYEGIMICLMFGLVAGAVTMNPVHPPALYLYMFAIMLPFTYGVASQGDAMHIVLAMFLVLFMVVGLMAGHVLGRNFEVSIRQRFENLDLVRQLEAQRNSTEAARAKLEQANAELRKQESILEKMVHERTSQLTRRTEEIGVIKDATVIAMTSLAETRDNETGYHIRRTQHYIRLLAQRLQDHPRFRAFLTPENIDLLFKLSPLHDVGKVGIPDHILLKPGKLTPEEFEIMKKHALLGGNAIAAAEKEVGESGNFLRIARQIAVGHHEKWDGSGYPYGLSGDDIPISARLMALVDVYDALSSPRVYKPALPRHEVNRIITEGRGTHFDPDIVDAFLLIESDLSLVAEKYRD